MKNTNTNENIQEAVYYQLKREEAGTGYIFMHGTYRHKCFAYMAKKRVQALSDDFCWVERISVENPPNGLFYDVQKEAHQEALLKECCELLEEKRKEIIENLWSSFHDETRKKQIMQALRKSHEGALSMLCELPDSHVIESIYLETRKAAERGHYGFALGMRIKGDDYVGYPGSITHTIAENETFEEMHALTKANTDMTEYMDILKELAIRMIKGNN